jgi:MarR family transcriptional repressor of emrRAB
MPISDSDFVSADKGVIRGDPYDFGMDDWLDEPPRPRLWGKPARPVGTVFGAVHGSYHVLSRRLRLEVVDHALGPSEAVVLAGLRLEPDLTIAVVRHRTGLRASTLDSLLDRLEARGLVTRVARRTGRGEVTIGVTATGRELVDIAHAALVEIDAELGVFATRPTLAGAHVVFEAARALGVPGTAADY